MASPKILLALVIVVAPASAGSPCTTLGPTAAPCTTVPPVVTCASFQCPPAPWTKKPGNAVCVGGVCTKNLCCACLTTTVVPTTTPSTCATFKCPPAPWAKKPNSDGLVCPSGGCTKSQCCA